MAFALKLPIEVARVVASMHDPFLDRVRAEGGTPSCRALENYNFVFDPVHPEYTCERQDGKFIVTERTEVLSRIAPYPNICVYEVLTPWYREERIAINISTSHGEYERNLRDRPYNSPVFFRKVACYE